MRASAAFAPARPFADPLLDDGLFDDAGRSSDSDSWLMSYLDMLMLLITFFVLMLTLYGGQLMEHTVTKTSAATVVSKAPTPAVGIPSPPGNAPLPLPHLDGFYQPPRQLAPAPIASDSGFYSPASAPSSAAPLAATPMVFRVPLFDLPDPDPAPALPQIEGVQVTAIPHGYNLRIQDHLLFDSSAVGVSDSGRRLIEKLIPLLTEFQGTISVEGHTDSVPISTARFPSNWELSAARAAAVVRVLRLAGIGGDRLRAIGYASTEPLANNDTPMGARATDAWSWYYRKPPPRIGNPNEVAPRGHGDSLASGKLRQSRASRDVCSGNAE